MQHRGFFYSRECPRNLSAESVSARPSVCPSVRSSRSFVHSIVDAITTASFYKVSFLIVLSSPRKFRRASLLEYAPETGSCRCWWTFGGEGGRKTRGREREIEERKVEACRIRGVTHGHVATASQ